jgi:alpha-beta hydrolase superfamily lysophospholipase
VIRRALATAAAAAIALALAAACAPRLQPPGPARAAPELNGEFLIAGDGMPLPVRGWLPDDGPPRAVIVALHGFNDYLNAFAIPAKYWRRRGIATYAYDQRGFGGSRHRGMWPGVEVMTADLRSMVAAVRSKHPGVPLYLLGVSMGGGVVMAALADGPLAGVDGAILVAPAVWARETMPVPYRVALWLAAHSVPWMTFTGEGLERVPSDNIEMLRALGRDPKVLKDARVDALWGIANLMDAALAAAPRITTPLLVLYGEKDDIIPKEPTRTMLERLSPGNRVAIYANGYHMLLRDLSAEIVHADVAAWLADPAAALPSGSDTRDALELLAGD